MRRLLIRILTLLSLLAALSAAVMWWRSHRRADHLIWLTRLPDPTEDDWQGLLGVYRIQCLQSSRGGVGFWTRNREVWLSTPFPESGFSYTTGTPLLPPNCSRIHDLKFGEERAFPNALGFALRWDRDRRSAEWPYHAPWTARMIVLPWWLLVGGFSIVPIVAGTRAVQQLRRRWMDPNHCRECGYDLRATPQRCPECGTPVPQSAPPLSKQVC